MKYMIYASALAIGACLTTAANAAPVLSSAADAASVTINAAGIIKADAVFAAAAGMAPPAYNDSGSLAMINQTAVIVAPVIGNAFTSANEALKATVVSSKAYSTLPSSATGSTEIANASISLNTKVAAAVPLIALGISADTITSTTTAGFGTSGLFSSGDSTIEGLNLDGSILGTTSIIGSLYTHAAANTVLLSALGIVITLNEQKTVQDASSISMFTNALHVSLSNYLLDGKLLSGDIILGHSQASVAGYVMATPAPEPATWALMVVGFGLVGASMRVRRTTGLLVHA